MAVKEAWRGTASSMGLAWRTLLCALLQSFQRRMPPIDLEYWHSKSAQSNCRLCDSRRVQVFM